MNEMTKNTGFVTRVRTGLVNGLKAIVRGELLLRLNVSRYFVHITFLFFAFSLVIWASLAIETSLSDIEKNRVIINNLETERAAKTYEFVALSRRSSVERRLEELGSKVTDARTPATQLEK